MATPHPRTESHPAAQWRYPGHFSSSIPWWGVYPPKKRMGLGRPRQGSPGHDRRERGPSSRPNSARHSGVCHDQGTITSSTTPDPPPPPPPPNPNQKGSIDPSPPAACASFSAVKGLVELSRVSSPEHPCKEQASSASMLKRRGSACDARSARLSSSPGPPRPYPDLNISSRYALSAGRLVPRVLVAVQDQPRPPPQHLIRHRPAPPALRQDELAQGLRQRLESPWAAHVSSRPRQQSSSRCPSTR